MGRAHMRCRYVVLLTATGVLAATTVGSAQVPTPQHLAACNAEAREATRTGSPAPGSAQPNTQDYNRAAEARRTGPAAPGAAGGPQSGDPQLAGMDPEGAKDPAYQAAYRTCMRKSGF